MRRLADRSYGNPTMDLSARALENHGSKSEKVYDYALSKRSTIPSLAHCRASLRAGKRSAVAALMSSTYRMRIGKHLRSLLPENLTVIVHHRICDPDHPLFFGMKSNVSATPEEFGKQLDFLSKHYNVVSLEEVRAWIRGGQTLPPRAVLITFDDGYRDNLTMAMPQLTRRSMPAAIFIATGYLGDCRAFYWDSVAEVFKKSKVATAEIPLLGLQKLEYLIEKESVAQRWVEATKLLPTNRLEGLLRSLATALESAPPIKPPSGTHLDWSDISELKQRGIAVGAHTVTHPILSRVPLSQARREIAASKAALEKYLGSSVYAFAYPNGRKIDFENSHADLLKQLDFDLGFQAVGCLTFRDEARRQPFSIRRVCVSTSDDLPRFAMKVSGLTRFVGQ